MKILSTISLLLAVVYLTTPTTAQLDFIIDGKTVGEILKRLTLGTTEAEWPNRMQPEGLGGIMAVLHRLRKMHPTTTDSLREFVAKHRIVSYGGLSGNMLDCLITSLIGSALGLQCDLWVIQEEERTDGSLPPPAAAIVKQILNIIRANPTNFPKIKLLNALDFEKTLEHEVQEIRDLKKKITNPTTDKEKEDAIEMIMDPTRKYCVDKNGAESTYQPLEGVDPSEYSLALDGITGTAQNNVEVKIGTIWSVLALKKFEHAEVGQNRLFSIDYPSLWLDGKKEMLPVYKALGLDPLSPGALLHVHSKKEFALGDDCTDMVHYVATMAEMKKLLKGKTPLEILTDYAADIPNAYVKRIVDNKKDVRDDAVLKDANDINISVDIGNERLKHVHGGFLAKKVNTYEEYREEVEDWFARLCKP